MIDGMASKPFSAVTLVPSEPTAETSTRETVIEFTRKKYTSPRSIVEKKVKEEWSSENVIGERIGRREEVPLEKVIRHAPPPPKRKPHFPKKPDIDISGLRNMIEKALDKTKEKEKE